MFASSEVGRIRRQQIVNLSITELMLLLVFMAVTFSFLSKEEDLQDVPQIQKELEDTKAKNHSLEEQIKNLNEERAILVRNLDSARDKIAGLERQLQELLPDAPPPVPNNAKSVSVPETTYKWLQARVTSFEKIARDLQAENAALRKQIVGEGGRAPGLPVCIVTSGYLLTFNFLRDGSISGDRAWDTAADSVASKIPGVMALSSGHPLLLNQFRLAAAEVKKWGLSQAQPCTFRVREKRETTDIEVFDKQLAAAESAFYVKRN
jgi:cell division protein FtsB